jgi:hypothetical protein
LSHGFSIPGDIALSDDGRYLLLWQGAEEVAARVAVAIQTFAGTWRYDQRAGVRYLFEIFEKPASAGLALLRADLWRVIRETPGIVAVVKMTLDFAPATREATVTWEAKTDAGPIGGTVVIR